jgi:Protein of unknown function (DUF2441)
MNSYYHINKNIKCNWKIGDEIDLGKEHNYYWQSLAEMGDSIEINGEKFYVDLISRHAFEAYTGKYLPPVKMKGYHFMPLDTLKETIDSLGNALKICRELAFESVRKEFYRELPSRQNCIWLIPDNEKSLEFWKNIICSEHQRIFKVTIDGKIHRAAQKWLIGGTFSLNKWNMLARSYWKGEDSGNIEDEILFEGKIKIEQEFGF